MNRRSPHRHRLTPLHALAAIALAAVGWHFLTQAVQIYSAAFSGARGSDSRCMYQVLMRGQCLGTSFALEPQSVRTVLASAGAQLPEAAGLEAIVPCDHAVTIDAETGGFQVDKITGDALVAAGRRIDVNSASIADLEAVPGIGPKLAASIVETRAARGPFARVDDLQIVPRIGRKKLVQVAPFLEARPVTSHLPGGAPPVRIASP